MRIEKQFESNLDSNVKQNWKNSKIKLRVQNRSQDSQFDPEWVDWIESSAEILWDQVVQFFKIFTSTKVIGRNGHLHVESTRYGYYDNQKRM